MGTLGRWQSVTALATIPISTRSRMGVSRRGGVPTALPPASPTVPAAQLGLAIPRPQRSTLLPGVVHIAGWLDAARQPRLVAEFRRWALPPAGLRHPRVPAGPPDERCSRCASAGTGSRTPTRRTADDTDGAPVKPLPADLVELARRAVADTFGAAQAQSTRPTRRSSTSTRPGARLGSAPGRRGAVGRSGGHDQPRRHVRVPPGRRRPAHRPVHRRRAALRRPARVRRPQPAHLPRRAQGARRHRPGGPRPAAGPAEHHGPRDRPGGS